MCGAISALAFVFATPNVAAEAPDWVAESNRHAQVLLDLQARFSPEFTARIGLEGYDEEILDLRANLHQRSMQAMAEAQHELEQRLTQAKHPKVRQDLEILIQAAADSQTSQQLQYDHMLPYFNIPQTLFFSGRGLLDSQVPAARQQAIVRRLQRYAGLEEGYRPLVDLAKERTQERFAIAGLHGPYRGEVEQDLADAPRYIEGLKQLLTNSQLDNWQDAMAALENQLNDYIQWQRDEILPRSRENYRLPEVIYADNLKNYGVTIDPRELIDLAQRSFAEIRYEMEALAPLLAKQNNLASSDYRDVIRTLRGEQYVGEAILPAYQQRLRAVEDIIREHEIVSLPARDAVIRLASEAETAATPAPHMQPPRLIGNTGELGEFVLPLNVPTADGEALEMNDFTFDAAAWTLTAHEARPGHEMQFAAMIENGVSSARAIYAFNSTNAEGWGLYAEAIVKPYLPLDGQLISLQMRLQRAARAFLDPMLNLGLITSEKARDFIINEVVLSPAMAKQEVDRYTYRAPGQATSYFFGYIKMMSLRARTELALDDQFKARDFHDFILAQGLLPPNLLAKAVEEEFIPSYTD